MVSFLSSWVKNLSLALIIVSILEMIIPNNKTKKYIRMVMGLYVLFSIISPFIENSNKFNIDNLDFNSYIEKTQKVSTEEVNQDSMNTRLKQIYIEKLENDITTKIEEKGYDVESCKVDAYISEKENDSGINKIVLNIQKNDQSTEAKNSETIEEKIVTEVQKIQNVNIGTDNSNEKSENKEDTNVTNADIQNIKKFLIDEYGVSEKCLKIN